MSFAPSKSLKNHIEILRHLLKYWLLPFAGNILQLFAFESYLTHIKKWEWPHIFCKKYCKTWHSAWSDQGSAGEAQGPNRCTIFKKCYISQVGVGQLDFWLRSGVIRVLVFLGRLVKLSFIALYFGLIF